MDSGIYVYDLKKGDGHFDEDIEKMNGKPICTKYTIKPKSCNHTFYHINPKVVKDERMPPEFVSSKTNSKYIIENLEIYFCKIQDDIMIGTGNASN